MSAYVAIRFEVTNPEAYGRYRELAGPSVKAHGGSIVTMGAMEYLEGSDTATNFGMLEFPSDEQAKAWFESSEYQLARDARAGAGDMSIAVIS